MAERRDRDIRIRGAETHNLKGFDVRIPRRSLTVITGVSGSGKSSLAFDTLFREGQRRFLETLPSFARQFVGGLARPAVRGLEGLGPAVAVGQRPSLSNPRSTVGTLTEGWDLLRLLFARLGSAPEGVHPTRGLFSFNGEEGACPRCQGLGVEDRLDPDLLVADPARSLREGALRVSTPGGYLMYSQVTLPVLDDVLRAHGGSVDIPWRDLTDEARQVVLHGSDRLKVPYGKHPLESRLKWTGITARPRQEGFYRGLLPVMEEILRGKRNDSILRFVRSAPCPACQGARLRPEALAVTWQGRRIVDLAALTVKDLRATLASAQVPPREAAVLEPIRAGLLARCDLMVDLGLGYLALDRPAPSLSRGEAQRLRLIGLALGELRGLLVVLDEPSAGLHPSEVGRLVQVLKRLRDQGQTVVVVEHDALIARSADWLIDLGPGPGREGGQLLWSGPPADLLARELTDDATPTQRWLAGALAEAPRMPRPLRSRLRLEDLARHNLQNVRVDLHEGCLNVLCGVSGAGKTSLLEEAVARLREGRAPGSPFRRIVAVDADPIGRTPRSNAATYTGAFDLLRDLFAASPEAKRRGFGKGHFSFNTAGGRCEACEGAGVQEVGMRYLGTVDQVCETCGGRRFHPEVLEVKVRDRSIADLLEGSVAEALGCFADQPRLRRILDALRDVGLGYLPLGQPATTLSGGEAQRVKLAAELARASAGPALIALDEPTTGLHAADVKVLLAAWDHLLGAGHTLLAVDNDLDVVRHADHVVELGPGSGPEGGRVVVEGTPADLAARRESLTGAALRAVPEPPAPPFHPSEPPPIELLGVRTHNLQGFDVTLPAQGFTVVTGPSGSGKSSLVFDTLLAEAQNRFADLVSPWARRLLPRRGGADLEAARGLQATLSVPPHAGRRNPRSTLATATELEERLRLLWARAGERPCPACGRPAVGEHCPGGHLLPALWAWDFSPRSEQGACPRCRGLGFLQRCDPERLVSHPDRPLEGGAMDGTRFGAYLGEADGQFVATLRHVAAQAGLDLSRPWRELGPAERELAMRGTGDTVHEVAWRYRRGKAEGVHLLKTPWPGYATLVEREYGRIHADPRGEELEALMMDLPCPDCGGERLREAARAVRFDGLRLPELMTRPVEAALAAFEKLDGRLPPRTLALTEDLRRDILDRLHALSEAGLGYLALQREMASLSGGEAQRVRLAAALGGSLVGVTYVLDEPTQGLHPRDVDRLGGVLRRLADAGNAVVLVEHDRSLIAAADHVIELGPGAGPEGGRLVTQGPPGELAEQPDSRTGALFRRSPGVGTGQPWAGRPGVRVRGAHLHNLQGLDVTFPAGVLVAVTGVSGSGKSSLVREVLGASLRNQVQGRGPVGCAGIDVQADIRQVLSADQAAPGLAWNSTVLTLAGLGDPLRRRFAATPQAKASKLTAKHFSTAAPGGRCEACEGRGVLTVAMDLLPDVVVGCETCQGRRFKPEVLACRLEGRNIAGLLEASVAELAAVFAKDARLSGPLRALEEIGLGYLRLGQEGSALSEGERQRLRLAGLLAAPPERWAALLMDEPTRGLGFEDVDRLAAALRRLAADGHLVVAVEHDLDFIAQSDWVIDLGPEGGSGGGRIIAEGPPEALRACPVSHTGRALAARID
ncbi:ATP-binding cassette domain-containing protein [Geothrix fermentans]|uniref:ATP-binding cassette domain-containing protein n=1 Tax=Geothrix fermentans TaxID=44676 RepID=UPI0004229EA8|nr:ATP-binding cassette domain-containing protein [Geothrix fermentans]